MTQQTLVVRDFPQPAVARVLSPNGPQPHWSVKRLARQAVENHVFVAATMQHLRRMTGHVTLQPTFIYPVARRRDGDNLTTGVLKVCIDSLVRLRLLVDDTTDNLTTLPPVVRVEPGRRALILEFSSGVPDVMAAHQPIGGEGTRR